MSPKWDSTSVGIVNGVSYAHPSCAFVSFVSSGPNGSPCTPLVLALLGLPYPIVVWHIIKMGFV